MSVRMGDEVVDTFHIGEHTITVFGAYMQDAPAGIYEHYDLYLDDNVRGVGHCMNEGSPFFTKPTREDAERLLQEYLT